MCRKSLGLERLDSIQSLGCPEHLRARVDASTRAEVSLQFELHKFAGSPASMDREPDSRLTGWSVKGTILTCRSTILAHQAYYEWSVGVPRRVRANARYLSGLSQPFLSLYGTRIGPNGRCCNIAVCTTLTSIFPANKKWCFLNNPSERFLIITLHAPQLESSHTP